MIATWRHPNLPMSFWKRVVLDPSGCWLWTGSLNTGGYGIWSWRGHGQSTHRWTYRTFVGEVPAPLELDHLCRTPACCNPDHLEVVTKSENLRRAYAARRAAGLSVARGCAVAGWKQKAA